MDRARANRLSLTLLTVLVMAVGCTSEVERQFEQQYAEAERLRVEAAAAGAEWLQTEDLLKLARNEAVQQNMDAALVLVEQARFQAETAIRQAETEAEAWRGRVVR